MELHERESTMNGNKNPVEGGGPALKGRLVEVESLP